MKKKIRSPRLIAALFFVIFLFIILEVSLPNLKTASPSNGGPILLLSNETGNDLSKTITNAIDSARESIVLSIYNISDNMVLAALNKKAQAGIQIILYTDAHASWPGLKILHKEIKIHLWKTGALMHQKILVIDKRAIYLGSANFSWNSLNLHRNLVLAFNNEEAAEFLTEQLECSEFGLKNGLCTSKTVNVGGQIADIMMFPDSQDGAAKIIKLIEAAEKSIRIAMYTWTRTDFAGAIASAQLRGVRVEVVLDRSAISKMPNPVIDILNRAHIETRIYQGPGLLHHKFLWIDSQILLSGSANWTMAAFKQNRESNILLNTLTETQQKVMETLWKSLKKESKQLT